MVTATASYPSAPAPIARTARPSSGRKTPALTGVPSRINQSCKTYPSGGAATSRATSTASPGRCENKSVPVPPPLRSSRTRLASGEPITSAPARTRPCRRERRRAANRVEGSTRRGRRSRRRPRRRRYASTSGAWRRRGRFRRTLASDPFHELLLDRVGDGPPTRRRARGRRRPRGSPRASGCTTRSREVLEQDAFDLTPFGVVERAERVAGDRFL